MCWPRANAGASNITGILRSTPDDFEVTETLTFEPEGEGEHLYVLAEKRGVTTRAVQQMLASRCGVPLRDVSYAGMKDRHAVARQWFSVRRPQHENIRLGESLQPREREGVPRKKKSARGYPSHEESLQLGSARVSLARREPSAGEREGIPLTRASARGGTPRKRACAFCGTTATGENCGAAN